jgi:hypothetical protein
LGLIGGFWRLIHFLISIMNSWHLSMSLLIRGQRRRNVWMPYGVCEMFLRPPSSDISLRLSGHPTWGRSNPYINVVTTIMNCISSTSPSTITFIKLLLICQVHLFSEGFSPPYNFSLWFCIIWEFSQLKSASMSQDVLDDWITSLLSTRSNREIAKLVHIDQDRVRAVRAAHADHTRILH